MAVKGAPVRALVVEDEKRVASAVKRGLEAEGFAVNVALTGSDGRRLAEANPYDVIVLDTILPGVDGNRLCAELRDRGDWTPVLMLTRKDSGRDETGALGAGADDYLAMPFSHVDLAARIRSLLHQPGKMRRRLYEAGDLRLEPAAHRCWRGETPVALTGRELSVLEFLLKRKGEVVPKSEILDNVWDFDFDGNPNIVEVYIRHLRRKIDEPFGKASIETVRGAGYRLAVDGG